MKKLTALLLTPVLICSLSVTAFAAGGQTGTTTITAEVPEASYTIHLPADMELEYGKTDVQVIGDVYVSDVVGVKTSLWVKSSAGKLMNDNGDIIPVHWYYAHEELPIHDVTLKAYYDDLTLDDNGVMYGGPNSPSSGREYFYRFGCLIEESDWNAAAPGTYNATMTFYF